ncbi:MAG: arylesterase [Burkholderiales bacterium]|nr:arylesterase [Burkholderiales bacterium]
MKDVVGLRVSRRAWLAHCTALATLSAAVAAGIAPPRAHAVVAAQSKILVVGDSLSAEYGLERGSGWVSLLEKRIAQEKLPATVVNASISGDTSSGGRSRLAALLKQHQPTHVILELGGNDALRGLPLTMTQDNLSEMTHAAKASGAQVLIVGMQVPPNYGRKYSDDFAALFASVAKKEGAQLVPFMLKGVADAPQSEKLFQADRIHPRAEAHPTILANVWPVLKPMLRR